MSAFKKPNEEMEYILATDVGSTTTKARFFRKRDGEWRYVVSGEAPTTVEEPFEDVTAGVKNAVREVEELTGHVILSRDGSGIIVPCEGDMGVDLYCTTSSAGGGLQMMVSGVIKSMTAESANRAALGAGAIVMDVMAVDDGREEYQKIRRIRSLRPDMILLAGGTDGGQRGHVLGMAEMMKASEPKPRLGAGYKLPLVYAGNKVVRPEIKEMMGDAFALSIVDNIRPSLEVENTEPARNAVHELFMEHVMSHAPGYLKLMTWTDVDIMPTPAGEGIGMQLIAKLFKKNVLGVGLGGATTNVYSIVGRKFVRSVSANLGMSYSICNVMKESGLENIMRWLPFEAKNETIRGRLVNKMIRPTTIPQTLEELVVEHSVAREALRLGLKHHTTIATRLKGVLLKRDIADMFDQKVKESYIDMMNIDVVAGTGGLLSHAPRRVQSMLILTDAWQLEGVTGVFQDSVFMMPHLGVLSTVYEEAAMNIFAKDCLINLGTVIAPIGLANEGVDVMTVNLEMPDGTTREEHMKFGEIRRIPLEEGKEINFSIYPRRGFDVGSGSGKELEGTIKGGIVGIMLDARGRPLNLPEDPENRRNIITSWLDSLDVYPEGKIEKIREKIGRS
ncbi:methylaspartate mutase [Candidatus Bathyarchaeota archaeon]|nr:MAG: methylaspartate mutase [Candidatus Bathyarchaeota archaeon]